MTVAYTLTEHVIAWALVLVALGWIVHAVSGVEGIFRRLDSPRQNIDHTEVLVQQMFAENLNVNRYPDTAHYGATTETKERLGR